MVAVVRSARRLAAGVRDAAVNASFRTKLFISYFALASFIILLLGFAYYQISARNMLANVSESLGDVVLNHNLQLDETLRDIRDKSEVLPIDEELYQTFTAIDSNDSESLLKADRRITQILFRYFGGDDNIYSAFIMTPDYAFGSAARMFVPPEGFFSSGLRAAAAEAGGDLVWVPAYRFADVMDEPRLRDRQFEYDRLVSAVKQLNLTYIDERGIFHTLPDHQDKPVLLVNLTIDYFRRLFEDYAGSSGFRRLSYGIAAPDGTVIASPEADLAGKREPPPWLAEALERKRGMLRFDRGGSEMLVRYDTMESTGWLTWIEIPVRDALLGLGQLKGYTILFLAVMLSVSALLAYLMSFLVTTPLVRIKQAIRTVERGRFDARIPEGGRDEFGRVIRLFNQMNERIAALIEENYAARLREKEAELMALNLQLNPHFLYNTLTTLYWIALENGQQEMARVMLNLSDMLQTTTRNKREMWPLRTDLDWLEKYAYIMSIRFEDLFTMDVDVAEDLLDLDVPKLFLQPFVENAIIHGFAEMDGGGVIRIRGRREGEAAVFTVEDNGRGFPPERLARMASGEGQSTGMANVGKRIRLLYGPQYGVAIESVEGRGTRIVIRLALSPPPRAETFADGMPAAPAAANEAGERRGQPCG
jgi:Predicted signal transduction protein with a C-terminal ATPase domain